MTFCELALDTFSEAGIAMSNLIAVPKDRQGDAEDLLNRLVFQCKVCLECQSFIRPSCCECPVCGAHADERTPDEIRAEYYARWLAHQTTR